MTVLQARSAGGGLTRGAATVLLTLDFSLIQSKTYMATDSGC